MSARPFDLLNKAINNPVLVLLHSGKNIRGTLQAFDVHMNVVLENAEELDEEQKPKTKYGTIILRGGTIVLIST